MADDSKRFYPAYRPGADSHSPWLYGCNHLRQHSGGMVDTAVNNGSCDYSALDAAERRMAQMAKPESAWTPAVTHFAAFILGGVALLLSLNYFGADSSTIHREEVTVVSKETHKRHHSRRVGRRRYTTGEPYYVYDLNLRFPTAAQIYPRRSRAIQPHTHRRHTHAADGEGLTGMACDNAVVRGERC